MTSDAIQPANRDRINITFTSYTDSDNIGQGIAQRTGWHTGTQRNLFFYGEVDGMGGHPAHTKLARLQNPDTPLYLEKPVIWPPYQCQYNDVTILFYLEIIVNDSGSLVGDRLLGLTKLGIGLGFGRTFFVLLEEGWFDSTGF
jgi:hypothetical protein